MSKRQKGANSPNEHKKTGDTSKKLLNRKTKRENNINPFEFITPKIRCSICLEYQKFSTKCYKCTNCSSYFHLDCYNYFKLNENNTEDIILDNNNINNFICIKCKEDKPNNPIICSICREHEGILKKLDNNYYHHYCYFIFKDNIHNIKLGNCKECKKRTLPSIGCTEEKCKERYHIKCALENGIIYSLPYYTGDEKIVKETFNEYIPFKCPSHNTVFFNNYMSFITAMTQSINDNINAANIINDNNPININQNNNNTNNGEVISINNENNNNNLSNYDDDTKKIEIDNKSISSNLLSDDNYEVSNNGRDDASDRTPPNNIVVKNTKNNDKNNNIQSTENIINNCNNKDVIKVNLSKNNNSIQHNDNENNNKKENSDNIKNDELNKIEEDIDISMEIEDVKKTEGVKENKEKENNKEEIEKEKDISDSIKKINLGKKAQINEKEKEKEIKLEKETTTEKEIKIEKEMIIEKEIKKEKEIKEEKKEDYKIPEIKYEKIDLYENFRKMNENYCYPGCFYRLHGI